MPFSSPKVLLGLSALTLLLFDVSNVTASLFTPHKRSPKVLGFDFKKEVPRNTPLASRLRKRQKTVAANIDNEEIAYIINMTVGTPGQSFSVQLDTGSSDIWIPSAESNICREEEEDCQSLGQFDSSASSSFVDVGVSEFQIQYEDNSAVTGDYINETLAIGNTVIKDMTMGLALQATRPFGIMGIGYDADESIASQDPAAVYPNIVAQMKAQGFISTLAYSLWLNDLNSLTGSILFGGVDTAKYHGNLVVLPVQTTNGTYTDFTVALSSVSVLDCSGAVQFSQTNLALPVILDSGTTDAYLPDSVLNPILGGVGVINDNEYGSIVPCDLANSPATFSFGFGGSGGLTISVALGEFVTPIYNEEGVQPTFKDGAGTICSWGLMSSGTGPILLGDAFLRSAYVVYDLTNNQIGMAQTNFNTTETNVVEISGSSIPGASITASAVMASQTFSGIPQETDANTKTGSAQATAAHGSPTFDLCVTETGKVSAAQGTHKGAAFAVGPPRVEVTTFITGVVLLVSLAFGSSVVLLR